MSEYQYYELRAVDRALDTGQREQLRALSSRATITAAGFVNSYDWGDFKGDPNRLMESHFDLFLYLANWGFHRFSMRFPRRLLGEADLTQFVGDSDLLAIRTAGESLIVDVMQEEVAADDLDDGSGWLDALAPLRADALDGDLRVFYLAWLMAVGAGLTDDDDVEPLAGIGALTPQLEAFAEFFGIDGDLVKAAANAQAGSAGELSSAAVAESIQALDETEKNGLLLRLYEGDPHLRLELRRRLRESATDRAEDRRERRTVTQLRALADRMAEDRRRAEEKRTEIERQRREQEEAQARARRLNALAARGEYPWKDVEGLIELRNGPAYEKAAALLCDLRDLALHEDTDDVFHDRLVKLQARHEKKARLIERLAAAGLD